MAKGSNLRVQDVIAAPDFVQAVVLAANTGQAFDTPAGMGKVLFSMTGDFWVKYGSTAALVPSTSTTGGSSSPELNPTMRDIVSTAACTGISIIAAAVQSGSLAWYKPA